MNRMSDLLTRWLYGNTREGSDQQNEQEGNQSAPTESESQSTVDSNNQSAGSSQNQIDTNEMSVNSGESQVQSDIGNQPLEYQQSETDEKMCSDEKNETHENGKELSSQTEGSEKSEHDSSDSKSDTSQTSFVHKIESMHVDDSDPVFPVTQSRDNVTYAEAKEVESGSAEDIYNPIEPTLYPESRMCTENETADSSVEIEEKQLDYASFTSKDKAETGCISKSDPVVKKELVDRQGETDILPGASDQNETLNYNPNDIGQYRDTVSAAVSSLRAQNVKPVVSLHYSAEGTSASMIKVGFTRFHSIEEEIAEDNHDISVASSDISDQRLSRQIIDDDDDDDDDDNRDNDISVSMECNEVRDNDDDEDDDGIGSHSGSLSDKSKTDREMCRVKADNDKDGNETQNVETVVEMSTNENSLHAMNEKCDNESAFKPFSVKSSDSTPRLVLDTNFKENNLSKMSQDRAPAEMPSCSYHVSESGVRKKVDESDVTSSVDKCSSKETEPAPMIYDSSKGASNNPISDDTAEVEVESSRKLLQGQYVFLLLESSKV